MLCSADICCQIILWDFTTGLPLWQVHETGETTKGLKFIDSGKLLLTASASGKVALYNTLTGAVMGSAQLPHKQIGNMAVSAIGTKAAICCESGTVYIVNLPQLSILRTFEAEPYPKVAFSPDDRLLISGGKGDSQVPLWDNTDGRKLVVLPRHEGRIYGIAFSPQGTHFAVCGVEQQVKIWDLQILRRQLKSLGLDWTHATGSENGSVGK